MTNSLFQKAQFFSIWRTNYPVNPIISFRFLLFLLFSFFFLFFSGKRGALYPVPPPLGVCHGHNTTSTKSVRKKLTKPPVFPCHGCLPPPFSCACIGKQHEEEFVYSEEIERDEFSCIPMISPVLSTVVMLLYTE